MDRIALRLDRLRESIRAEKLDALLVSSPTNVAYLTGFTGDSSLLLLGKERELIISDGRFTTQIEQECPGIEAFIREGTQSLNQAVISLVQRLGYLSLGFEAAVLSVADHEVIRKGLSGVSLVPTTDRVETIRQVKDAREIEEIREAVGFAERAFEGLRGWIRPGMTEKDVADQLEANLRSCGASGSSFPPIVAVGPRAALPHARPTTDHRIGEADFVLLDWGATGRPYKSDLTRVLVTGNVTPKFAKVYETVLTAQERAIAAIRPGVRAHDIDAAARSFIEQEGYGRFFEHSLGHGLGMEIHEAPRLRKGSDVVLEPGMVVTVEPGIYLAEWGGVRIEDDVLVTPEGCEVLSQLPKTLDSLKL